MEELTFTHKAKNREMSRWASGNETEEPCPVACVPLADSVSEVTASDTSELLKQVLLLPI